MGIVRLLLALSVLIVHSSPMLGLTFVPGDTAVQAFYLISGFYISLVLGRKYPLNREGIQNFYFNRFFRLAPGYWVVAALSLIMVLITKTSFFYDFRSLSIISQGWVIFTNLALVGLDTLMFLIVPQGSHSFQFSSNSTAAPFPGYRMSVIHPAWSLGVELWFYILAPLLTRFKTSILFLVAAGSLLIRGVLALSGRDFDPWSYRFFPSELMFFVGGMLLNRFYLLYRTRFKACYGVLAFLLVVGSIVSFDIAPGSPLTRHIAFLAIFAAAIPFIFEWSRNNRYDRAIGELSYPIYVCHSLIFSLLLWKPALQMSLNIGTAGAMYSILFAAILYLLIDGPVDRMRHRIGSTS